MCSYDRAGLGLSDPRPAGVAPTGERFADDLHTLLANAGIPGPYILLGDSFAGLLLSQDVLRYPADALGLVFVDAAPPSSCYYVADFLPCGFGPPEPAEFGTAINSVSFGNRPVVDLTAVFETPDLARRSTDSIWADGNRSQRRKREPAARRRSSEARDHRRPDRRKSAAM